MFYNIAVNPWFFCSARHNCSFRNEPFLNFSFCARNCLPALNIKDLIDAAACVEADQILYIYFGIFFREQLSFLRKNIVIITQSLYQHFSSSLYFFTSITPFIIWGL